MGIQLFLDIHSTPTLPKPDLSVPWNKNIIFSWSACLRGSMCMSCIHINPETMVYSQMNVLKFVAIFVWVVLFLCLSLVYIPLLILLLKEFPSSLLDKKKNWCTACPYLAFSYILIVISVSSMVLLTSVLMLDTKKLMAPSRVSPFLHSNFWVSAL